MGDILVPAIALMLVIEGLLPLAAPRFWRGVFRRMTEMTDGQVRFVGLVSVGIGAALLVVAT
ncbi:MAG TPA: DUF2065 domain-containing protein [Usitatibacter sp.]|nr:DUF2065 domain-containing protein [Usitatibacter sp.]